MAGGDPNAAFPKQPGHNQRYQSSSQSQKQRPKQKTYTRKVSCTLEELALGTTKKLRVKFGKGKGEKIYDIRLKPGWKAGTKVTFQAVIGKLPTMIFVIEEKPHKDFRREGNDLHYVSWISSEQAKEGGVYISVALPSGEVWSKQIPKKKTNPDDDANEKAVLASGKKMVIPGKGMPIKGGPERGDLIVEFRIRRSSSKESSSA